MVAWPHSRKQFGRERGESAIDGRLAALVQAVGARVR
jgi:hypothetical protein